MNDGRAPTPDFDSGRYERPNKQWECGHAAEGCPCRIGPSPAGKCRATSECTPRLTLKPGETKGTWHCTRPPEWGGPCADGPRPDGACGRAVVPCTPVRSLRSRRGLLAGATLSACLAALLIGFSGSRRDAFVNPRPLSRQHSGAEFVRLAAAAGGGQGCVLCHANANANLSELALGAIAAARGPLRLAVLAGTHPKDFSRMDHSCVACHAGQAFHQADIPRDTSCSVCHREHQGPNGLAEVVASACVDCHGSPAQMAAARVRSEAMPAGIFARRLPAHLIVPDVPRPRQGYTDVITDFAVDHPEFRPLRDHRSIRNPLKFSHRLHLAGDSIPLVDGHPLACASCHRLGAAGAYMVPVSFEESCRSCHALNFDERNPGMTLPHGDAAYVRDYLRSLPTQYGDYAVRRLGLRDRGEIAAFVRHQIEALNRQEPTGEALERAVFLGSTASGHTPFTGCALCHEVAWRANAAPQVAPPVAADRWLPGSTFKHSTHASTACTDCHAAAPGSEQVSDVLLPPKQSCVRCHSPAGAATDTCTGCHVYHNQPPAGLVPSPLTAALP